MRQLGQALGRGQVHDQAVPQLPSAVTVGRSTKLAAHDSASRDALSPSTTEMLIQSSNLRQQGRWADAVEKCEAVLQIDQDSVDALWLRGLLWQDIGNLREASYYLRKAHAKDPRAEICNDLGVHLLATAHPREATGFFIQAIQSRHDFVAAHCNLGIAYLALRKWRAALDSLDKAIRLDERFPLVRLHRGVAKRELGDYPGATADFSRGIELAPNDADLPANLGAVLRESGSTQRALTVLQSNLSLHPNHVPTLVNLGMTYLDLGQPEDASTCFLRAIDTEPENASAQFGHGLALLQQGRFSEGWPKYEYRFNTDWHAEARLIHACPRWDGRPMPSGSRLLITSEQGLGDQIMFASCLQDVLPRSASCVVECDGRLVSLFARSFPDISFVPSSAHPGNELTGPGFTAQIPIGSLPSLFRHHADTFPQSNGFLTPDPIRAAAWASALADRKGYRKIGLAWRAGTPRTGAAKRSTSIADWKSLLELPNLVVVNLQHDATAEEIAELNRLAHGRLQTIQDNDDSPDNYAALIVNLDLVITVCGTVAHLAGGVGAPVWIATPQYPEWRYGLRGTQWPWYPSAQLWRVGEAGWPSLVGRMCSEISGGMPI